MKLSHIINKVYFDPVMMTPQMHASIRAIVEKHLEDDMDDMLPEDETDFFGNPLPKPYNQDGVAVIPVYGTIAHKVGKMEKACGVIDVKDIKAWYNNALNDSNVLGIVFDIDSGGGFVTGVPELAQYIRSNKDKKPTCAFTDGMMASAAHYIAAGTDMIFATPSADVGSIGVYSYYMDVTRAYENEGVKVQLFSDGKFKGMGLPGISLTEEQAKYIQDDVEEMGKQFKGFICSTRNVSGECMQGQTFTGAKAIQSGLIEANADSLEDVIYCVKSAVDIS
jgi:signal peptide peptidase SppA